MIEIEHSVVINRPIGEVFAYVSEIENEPQWQSGVVEAHKDSQEPLAVGHRGTEVRQFLGRRMESTYEITAYEPDTKFGFKVVSGPIPMEGGYTLQSVEGGTRVTLAVQGEAGGFFKLAETMVGRMARRQIQADFDNLKDLLEEGAA